MRRLLRDEMALGYQVKYLAGESGQFWSAGWLCQNEALQRRQRKLLLFPLEALQAHSSFAANDDSLWDMSSMAGKRNIEIDPLMNLPWALDCNIDVNWSPAAELVQQ